MLGRSGPRLGEGPPQLGDRVPQVVDPRAGPRERYPRRVELRLGVAGTEPQLQPAVTELIGARGVTGQQHGVVERRVEHERAQSYSIRRLRGDGQCRKRREYSQVVGYAHHVVPEPLGLTCPVDQLITRGEPEQAHPEAERLVLDVCHTSTVGERKTAEGRLRNGRTAAFRTSTRDSAQTLLHPLQLVEQLRRDLVPTDLVEPLLDQRDLLPPLLGVDLQRRLDVGQRSFSPSRSRSSAVGTQTDRGLDGRRPCPRCARRPT